MLHHVEAIEHDLWICSGNVINSWGDEQISHIHWNRRDGWKVIIAKCIIIFIKRFHLPVVRYLLHSIVVRGRIPGWCTCTPSCRISHLCPSPKDDPASRTASLSLWNRVYQCSGASLWTSFQTPWRTRSSSLSTEGVSISRHVQDSISSEGMRGWTSWNPRCQGPSAPSPWGDRIPCTPSCRQGR